MKLAAYVDIIGRPGNEVTLHDIISFIVQQLHYASTKHGKLALAFPNMGKKPGLGDFVRAFAEEIETLNRVVDFLVEDPRVDEYTIVRRPKPVPDMVAGYESFSCFRVPHKLSGMRLARLGEKGVLRQEINMQLRQKRLAKLRTMPFVTLYSSTAKRQFRLYIERNSCGYCEGEPNGYGLSRKSQVVAVPIF